MSGCVSYVLLGFVIHSPITLTAFGRNDSSRHGAEQVCGIDQVRGYGRISSGECWGVSCAAWSSAEHKNWGAHSTLLGGRVHRTAKFVCRCCPVEKENGRLN
jgi:hypothetical protein